MTATAQQIAAAPVEPIEMTITLTITVTNAGEWADEYGIDPAAVREDVAAYYRSALYDIKPRHHEGLVAVDVRIC